MREQSDEAEKRSSGKDMAVDAASVYGYTGTL
jgi:hypothetical protein